MPDITVHTDFPGGNAELLKIDERDRTVTVRPELKGGSPHRGWFYFRLDGIEPGEMHRLRIVENEWAGHCFYSYDAERWHHFTICREESPTDVVVEQRFEASSAYIAMMPPYLHEQQVRLAADLSAHPSVEISQLWVSEEGNAGLLFTVANDDGRSGKRHVWIIARTHAFEAGASWVAEALLHWATANEEEALQLRRNAVLHVVPIVDIDSVRAGDSGKNRPPVDFNRDWPMAEGDTPHWNATRGIVEAMERSASLDLFIDLHSPHGNRRETYFYIEHPELRPKGYIEQVERFTGILKMAAAHSPMPFRGRYEASLDPADAEHLHMAHRSVLKRWWPEGLRFSGVLEIAWSASHAGMPSFISTGRNLGRSISRFLNPTVGTRSRRGARAL